MTRREAREALFEMIYEKSFFADENPTDFYEREAINRDINDSYIRDCFFGVAEHCEEIDEAISENLVGWKLGRLSRVTYAIMRLCCYEMLYTELSPKIAINEAVELSKKFDHDQAPSFVNGVLNALADKKNLKDKTENGTEGN